MNKKKEKNYKSWLWLGIMVLMILPVIIDLNYPSSQIALYIGGLFVLMAIAGVEVIQKYG